jgi:hypothetical protein
LRVKKAGEAGGRRRKARGDGLIPVAGEDDDDEAGYHPEEIAPAGGDANIDDGEQILDVGENEGEENDRQHQGEIAEPGRNEGTGTKEKGKGQQGIAGDVDEKNLPKESGLVGLPARRRIEEIEIESEGEDGDLEEIEEADEVDARGEFVGERDKDHEDWSGPDEEENVRRPGVLRRAGDEALIVGTDGLAEGFEGEGGGEEKPQLAGIAIGAAGGIVGADGGENHHGEIEGIGDEEIGGERADEFEIEDKEQREEETDCDRDAREPAGGEHEDLGRSVQQGKGEMESREEKRTPKTSRIP